MKIKLNELPFKKESMSKLFSDEALDFHHDKHHAAYVNKLNELIKDSDFEKMSLEALVKKAEGPMSQNASQVYNHDFFWKCISEDGGAEPGEKLSKQLRKYFGSYDTFIEKFTKAAMTLFGSGWVWLAMNKDDSLEILQLPNSGTPITLDKKPLLCLDVWEHSYYIDYRNDRAKYVEAFMQVIDWEFVSSQL